MKNSMNRRTFIKKSAAGAGLMLAVSFNGLPMISAAHKRTEVGNPENTWIPNAWLRITPDGLVTVLINKSEMGQGTWTGLAMVVADQMNVEWKDVRVEASPVRDEYNDPIFGMQLTGGSTGIRNMYATMSKAAATAREMLVTAAADKWNVPPEECQAQTGRVTHLKTRKSLSFGELCSQAAKVPVPKDPQLKPRDQFQYIGKNMPRLDMPDKVNGKPVFGMDVFVPGMLYSSMERPSVYGGKLLSFDKEAAEKIPGVLKVFTVPSGIAVVATNIEAAWKGRKALNAKWDSGSMSYLDDETLKRIFIDEMRKKGLTAKNVGDVEKALTNASQRMTSVYSLPYIAHAAFEPHNCTADVRPDSCEIWCPTQAQTSALSVAMKETGLPADKITIHTTMLGGGFGGKAEVKVVQEAVLISRTVGKPVKHIWSRKEDFQNDCFRPGSLHTIEGGIGDKGYPIAWRHKVVVSPIMERLLPARVKNRIDPTAVEGIVDMDYAIPNLNVEYVRLESPIPAGFWRSVGNSSNTFVVESFIDEMAHATGKDPLEFRLNLLKENPRAAGVLKKVADSGGWSKRPPEGIGRGIAVRFSYGSYAAQMAEVSVDKKTGEVRVHRMVTAIDPGQVVNPDSVHAQIEGATIMGISVALKENISFKNGGVATSGFGDYPILTMSEIPKIESHIITNDEKMGGVGEPCVPPVAPAIGNAVFAATGVRLRSLPMTADKVRSALKAKA